MTVSSEGPDTGASLDSGVSSADETGFLEALRAGWPGPDSSLRIGLTIAAALVVIVLVAVLSAWVLRRRLKNIPFLEGPVARVGLSAQVAEIKWPNLSPPDAIFPDQWFAGVDEVKLEVYLAKSKREAVRAFLAALGDISAEDESTAKDPMESQKPPGAESLKAAAERLALTVNRALTAPEMFEVLNGGAKLDPGELALLRLHLDRLLPPIRLPRPEVSPGEIRPLAGGLMTLLGAIAGNFILGVASTGETVTPLGRWLGSAVGAVIGSLLAVFLAQNNRVRRRLLAGVGGLAFFDALGSIFSGALLPGFLSPGKNSLPKRLLFYAGIILVLLLVKSKKVFDLSSYKDTITSMVDDYLSASIPLLLVIMFRLKDSATSIEQAKKSRAEIELTADLAFLVSRMRSRPEPEREPLFSQLVRKLENAGFEIPDPSNSQTGAQISSQTGAQNNSQTGSRASSQTSSRSKEQPPRKLAWDDSLADRYEPFGLIENGQQVIIEEEPVYKDGKVIRKGQAVPV
jgi:hypothetical protein